MEQIFTNDTFTVNYLVERIDIGALGLPELQRPFVWKDSKVRDLFDSMLKGYPVGYLMLWECSDSKKKKSIGVDGKTYTEPVEVIIDGQQRLTSLYAVMTGKKVVDANYREREIIISYSPIHNEFMVGNAAIKNSPEWIYNISDLFRLDFTYEYIGKFMAGLSERNLSPEDRSLIVKRVEELFSLKQYSFPVFRLKSTADEEDVSETFVRINSQGTTLNEVDFILTLLSVHWNDGRKQLDTFCRESYLHNPEKVTSFNSLGIKIQPKHIIRTLIAYAFNRGRLEYGRKMLKGDDLKTRGLKADTMRQNFDTLKAKLPAVMDVNNWHEFLKAIMNAGYLSEAMILSMNAVYYTYAMYLIARDKFNAPNNANKDLAALWFFYAEMTSLYSNSPESVAESHLNAIARLLTLEDYRDFIVSRVCERLTDDYFSITLPGSEDLAKSGPGNNAWFAYSASLNILGVRPLFSRTSLPVSAFSQPGVDGTKKALEKHHLFPKAYLKTKGYSDTQINQMANYAYIDWNDNIAILNKAPAEYYPVVCEGMSDDEVLKMESENALPHGWGNMSYEDFLLQRRKLMARIIKQAFLTLKDRAGQTQ